MLMHGSQEETKGRSPLQLGPFSVQPNDPRSQVNSVGPGFSRHFKSPAIFLHISCDGDFVLPITVGIYSCLLQLLLKRGCACDNTNLYSCYFRRTCCRKTYRFLSWGWQRGNLLTKMKPHKCSQFIIADLFACCRIVPTSFSFQGISWINLAMK